LVAFPSWFSLLLVVMMMVSVAQCFTHRRASELELVVCPGTFRHGGALEGKKTALNTAEEQA